MLLDSGINKPGGAGKITKVYHEDETDADGNQSRRVHYVDVKYTLGGQDRRVDVEFVRDDPNVGDYVRGWSRRREDRQSKAIERCGYCKVRSSGELCCKFSVSAHTLQAFETDCQCEFGRHMRQQLMLDASEECTILLENREKRGCTLLRQQRRRRGRQRPLANGGASGEESGDSDGEDDIPLAVLQRVKAMEQKQEKKRKRRKKRRLKLELKKKNRPKSRANLLNACTLSSLPALPAVEGDTDIVKISGNQSRLRNSEGISAPLPSTQDHEYKEMDEDMEYFDAAKKQLDKKEEEERDNDIDYFENAVKSLDTSKPTSKSGDEPMATQCGASQPVEADVDTNMSFLDPELSDGAGTDFGNGGGDSLGEGDDEGDIADPETDDSDSEDGSDDDGDEEFNPSTYLDRVNRALQSLPYLELMHYLDALHREIEEEKLPYARKRLRALGDNFDRIQNQFGGLNDEKEELEDLLDEW